MKLNKIHWKNIKSYGNALQEIDFSKFGNDGSLILLSGNNGSGKSTIKDVSDLAIFGKVPGKKKKYTVLSKLPNRHNESLYVDVNFTNHKNDDIFKMKKISPNEEKILLNNNDITTKYKKYSQKEKDDLIGYTYETFKSFISMSMNDFKDFIILTNQEKKSLVNKLFNLDILDGLSKITTDYIINLENKLEFNCEKLNNYKELINSNHNILKSLKENKIKKGIDEINIELKSLQDKYNNLKISKDSKIKENSKLNKKISDNNLIKKNHENELNKHNLNLENIIEKIELYDSGKCPYCDTNLKDDSHINLKDDMKNSEKLLSEKVNKIKNEIDEMSIEITKLINKSKNINNEINNIKIQMNELLFEAKTLKKEKKNIKENDNINLSSIESNYKSYKEKYLNYKNNIEKIKENIENHQTILNILKESKIKKQIIKKSIIPINNYIKEFSKETKTLFKIKLNNNFDAIINDRYDVDPELLSGGEDKKINIVIALSYLCTLLDRQHSNILFIDELFNSIDKENIEMILKLLRSIAIKYKINIIVVHHYLDIMDMKYFDFNIKVNKKNIYSDIEIKKISKK
jgi:DNA repair exonuclease SbcCD ATPase subunit